MCINVYSQELIRAALDVAAEQAIIQASDVACGQVHERDLARAVIVAFLRALMAEQESGGYAIVGQAVLRFLADAVERAAC